MSYKAFATVGLLCFFSAWGVSPLQAAIIPLVDGDGDDSGWVVESIGAALDLLPGNIIDVDLGKGIVTITVVKDFGAYTELAPGLIDFPFGALKFTEVDVNADKITRIIILSETISNNTGAAWDSFTWHVQPTGAAKFDTSDPSAWNVQPWFGSQSFETANKLVANNGSVADGAVFSPSGELVIDINLGASETALTFTLKQRVTPEPATMGLLLVGGLAVLSRRLRKQ